MPLKKKGAGLIKDWGCQQVTALPATIAGRCTRRAWFTFDSRRGGYNQLAGQGRKDKN